MQTINFERIALKSGDRLLDLGCGEGRHSIAAVHHHKNIEVFAIDLSHEDVAQASKRHQEFDSDAALQCLYARADAFSLPFGDNSFDHILCSEVLEHIHDYKGVLAEIDRVLKPGGSLSLSVPRFWPERICWWLSHEYHNVAGGHIRIFRGDTLRRDLGKLAYQFRHRHWAHALHVPYWWLRCAFWSRGNNFFLTRWYHRLLVWDLLHSPPLTRLFDRLLNPLMGKSVVMYFEKPGKSVC